MILPIYVYYDISDFAVMQLNRPPVNSLSLELLTEMQISLEKLENDKTCRGVILSTVNTVTAPDIQSSFCLVHYDE